MRNTPPGPSERPLRGRVLVVGSAAEGLGAALAEDGFEVVQANDVEGLPRATLTRLDAAVVRSDKVREAAVWVRAVRAHEGTAHLPLLLQAPEKVLEAPSIRSLQVDELLPDERAAQELERRVASLVRAKRLVDAEGRAQARLRALLEIHQAASTTLEMSSLLRIVVERLAEVLDTERCAVLLRESNGEVAVAASAEAPGRPPLKIDLTRWPELALALQGREPVCIADARTDARTAAVRPLLEKLAVGAILVQPLVSAGEVQGALFLRRPGEQGTFDLEDRSFVLTAAGAIADHLRNARMYADLRHKRDDLEAAYVDRYRELASANRRLTEANQFKDELLATCSHDLRSPLNVLLGHSNLMLDTHLTQRQRLSMEAMARQGRRILELVESLLEKGKGEAARLTLQPSEVDLSSQAFEAAKEIDILAQARGVTIRVEAPEELWTLGDRIKLRQVLQNLISNALQYADKKVTVHAERLRRDGGEVARLSVVDDGKGFVAEELPVVFDRYRHGSTGTGLGLSICREFVELHGGEIWAENQPGGGAVVRVLIPLTVVETDLRPERPRVLLVEDELHHAQAGSEILRTKYRVEIARDGAEGLAKARALKPDLVLMDVFLPKLDGLDATSALRRAPDTAHIPVLLISSHPEIAGKVRALHLGVVDMVTKPFDAKVLLQKVEQALLSRRTPPLGVMAVGGPPAHGVGVDLVTGLMDRGNLLRRGVQEQMRSQRYTRPLSLVVVRAEAEALSEPQLAQAARVLRASARGADIMGYLGEGVFALLLPECAAEGARSLGARMVPVLTQVVGPVQVRAQAVGEPPLEQQIAELVAAP